MTDARREPHDQPRKRWPRSSMGWPYAFIMAVMAVWPTDPVLALSGDGAGGGSQRRPLFGGLLVCVVAFEAWEWADIRATERAIKRWEDAGIPPKG